MFLVFMFGKTGIAYCKLKKLSHALSRLIMQWFMEEVEMCDRNPRFSNLHTVCFTRASLFRVSM
jgi:hypothetical protein